MSSNPSADYPAHSGNFLTLPEAAAYLRVSPRTVYRWAREGRLRCFRLGKTTRFTLKHLDDFVQRYTGGSDVPAAPTH